MAAFGAVAAAVTAAGANWHVATNGTAAGRGTSESPWDLESTLQGKRGVQAGDTVWISGGIYKHPNRKLDAMGYELRLSGTAAAPVQVRAAPGERVTMDGGLVVQAPAAYCWVRDLELIVSENFTAPRRIEETGSHPRSYNRPWGGLNIYSGIGCKFIDLVIHDNAQGVSWWTAAKDTELYGCVIYNNGWEAPDRGHGHAIYTQNDDGIKTISDCIMTGGRGYTLHAYGSSRADVNNYLVTRNICYSGGPFLIGSGKPSRNIRVLTNYFDSVPVQLGYDAPFNENCEVLGNIIVNGTLTINKYKRVIQDGNIVLAANDSRPAGTRAILNPNQYDPNRANLIILNWEKKPLVRIEPGNLLKSGDKFRLLDPVNFYGRPVLAGSFSGQPIELAVTNEFIALILLKN